MILTFESSLEWALQVFVIGLAAGMGIAWLARRYAPQVVPAATRPRVVVPAGGVVAAVWVVVTLAGGGPLMPPVPHGDLVVLAVVAGAIIGASGAVGSPAGAEAAKRGAVIAGTVGGVLVVDTAPSMTAGDVVAGTAVGLVFGGWIIFRAARGSHSPATGAPPQPRTARGITVILVLIAVVGASVVLGGLGSGRMVVAGVTAVAVVIMWRYFPRNLRSVWTGTAGPVRVTPSRLAVVAAAAAAVVLLAVLGVELRLFSDAGSLMLLGYGVGGAADIVAVLPVLVGRTARPAVWVRRGAIGVMALLTVSWAFTVLQAFGPTRRQDGLGDATALAVAAVVGVGGYAVAMLVRKGLGRGTRRVGDGVYAEVVLPVAILVGLSVAAGWVDITLADSALGLGAATWGVAIAIQRVRRSP